MLRTVCETLCNDFLKTWKTGKIAPILAPIPRQVFVSKKKLKKTSRDFFEQNKFQNNKIHIVRGAARKKWHKTSFHDPYLRSLKTKFPKNHQKFMHFSKFLKMLINFSPRPKILYLHISHENLLGGPKTRVGHIETDVNGYLRSLIQSKNETRKNEVL